MRRRVAVLATMLLVVAVTACGSDGGDDPPDAGFSGDEGGLAVRVSFTPDPLRPGGVTFMVVVRNDGDDDVALEFRSGQRAEVSLRQGEETAYTWSATRSFIQALSEDTVPAGEEMLYALDEPAFEVAPGEYTLDAVVTSWSHPDLRVSRRVTVRSG